VASKCPSLCFVFCIPDKGDDDEDAPMISGFSDDVPMVIA